MIRTTASEQTDWLDACCWGCGTPDAVDGADGRVLCGPCREELLTEAASDPIQVARHSYWEAHALGCCWRCMARAVDPGDEVGICPTCREQLGAA